MIFVALIIVSAFLYYLLAETHFRNNNLKMLLLFEALVIIMFFVSYYTLRVFLLVLWKEIRFRDFFQFYSNSNRYYEMLHKMDIEQLNKILKKYGVNTRPKVQEIIRHYQALLPRKNIQSGMFLSIIALTISALALILNDNVFYSEDTALLVATIIFVVVIFYFFITMANKKLFAAFGETELYKRLESSLAEIYIKQIIK